MAEAEDAPVGSSAEVGALLTRWRAGDAGARDRLTPTVYAELKSLARGYMRREAPGHTLQPTALVHEACLRRPARGVPLVRRGQEAGGTAG